MRINPLVILIFLFINTSFCLMAYSDRFYYSNDLDLCLFKNGVASFLNMSRNESDNRYYNALWDIIRLAPDNGRNASYLLEAIHNSLEHRINRIENIKGKKIEREVIMKGLGFIALGIGSSCVTYYFYKNYYCANN